jgi:hypothetical protein
MKEWNKAWYEGNEKGRKKKEHLLLYEIKTDVFK